MKNLKILMLFTAFFLMNITDTNAKLSVNANISSQPLWGPVSYDRVEYYYMPEYDMYYNSPKAQFIHRKGNKWIYSNALPYQYKNANLYSTYKVVINDPKPYLKHNFYSKKYKGYKNYRSKQSSIRDSKHSKYKVIKNHPSHSKKSDKHININKGNMKKSIHKSGNHKPQKKQ
ncbi:hypothetical protein [Flavobacterium sp.]|jgi:hypothetical protein|uniref:hypothetical protein n=1 Tax=Flavobacterium sp. TaxID=239 RepID=UPI002A83CEDC|nr:hypothetical protein [Flavobacterium sp.]